MRSFDLIKPIHPSLTIRSLSLCPLAAMMHGGDLTTRSMEGEPPVEHSLGSLDLRLGDSLRAFFVCLFLFSFVSPIPRFLSCP